MSFNHAKHSGKYVYVPSAVTFKSPAIFPTWRIYVFPVILNINSDYVTKQHQLVGRYW